MCCVVFKVKGLIKMNNHSVRPTDDEIKEVVTVYSNMLFKLCFSILCSTADAEDAVSDTFVKYMTKAPYFNGEEHRKAWLLRVAVNICKNMCRFRKRNGCIDIDEVRELAAEEKDFGVLEQVMKLPEKYKTIIHLHYVEGYKVKELAKILDISETAAKKRLQYGRNILKAEYGKED